MPAVTEDRAVERAGKPLYITKRIGSTPYKVSVNFSRTTPTNNGSCRLAAAAPLVVLPPWGALSLYSIRCKFLHSAYGSIHFRLCVKPREAEAHCASIRGPQSLVHPGGAVGAGTGGNAIRLAEFI